MFKYNSEVLIRNVIVGVEVFVHQVLCAINSEVYALGSCGVKDRDPSVLSNLSQHCVLF